MSVFVNEWAARQQEEKGLYYDQFGELVAHGHRRCLELM